jgi:hypothetical protein
MACSKATIDINHVMCICVHVIMHYTNIAVEAGLLACIASLSHTAVITGVNSVLCVCVRVYGILYIYIYI